MYVDSADMKLMFNFLVSTMLSAGVLTTAIYYQMYGAKNKGQRQQRSASADKHHRD